MSALERTDPEIWAAIELERGRQKSGLELIASENYTSAAVLEAAGTILTNKYAEGYPGRRYYGGCEFIDSVEELARRAGPRISSAASTPTSNRTPARRPTCRCISP